MRRLTFTLLLPAFLLTCFWLPPAQASGQTAQSKVQKHTAHYVSVKHVPPTILPAPPARHSRAERNEHRQIMEIQTYVAGDEIAAARYEQDLNPEHVASVLGESYTRAALPLTFALLDRAGEDTGAITTAAKKYWHTTRPYLLDKRIKLHVDALPRNNYGYPSGHTSTSLVWAEILASLVPGEASKLEHQADRIAMHRLIAGVHTPRDISGGEKLGAAILQALRKDPRFLSEVEQARAEIHRHQKDLAAASDALERKKWTRLQPRIGASPLGH